MVDRSPRASRDGPAVGNNPKHLGEVPPPSFLRLTPRATGPQEPRGSIVWHSNAAADPWAETRRGVAGLRVQAAECRYWREQFGQEDPDTIAANLERNHCYP